MESTQKCYVNHLRRILTLGWSKKFSIFIFPNIKNSISSDSCFYICRQIQKDPINWMAIKESLRKLSNTCPRVALPYLLDMNLICCPLSYNVVV